MMGQEILIILIRKVHVLDPLFEMRFVTIQSLKILLHVILW